MQFRQDHSRAAKDFRLRFDELMFRAFNIDLKHSHGSIAGKRRQIAGRNAKLPGPGQRFRRGRQPIAAIDP